MNIVDISGPIENGMWHYPEPYPATEVTEIPSPPWIEYSIYSQEVKMSVQTSTYLETAAHLDPSRISIDAVPLERCVMVPAFLCRVVATNNTEVTGDMIRSGMPDGVTDASMRSGALIVDMDWSRMWRAPEFLSEPPFFSDDAMDYMCGLELGILGADTPRFDSPVEPRQHLRRFFETDTLMLAPVANLSAITNPVGSLTALPLAITGACASPVRAIWTND